MQPRLVIVAISVIAFTWGCGSPPPGGSPKKASAAKTDVAAELATIQAALRKPGAPASHFRIALEQLNSLVPLLPDNPIAPLSSERTAQLKSLLNLSEAEIAQLAKSTLDPLDAHYLHECALFRDAARTLDVAGAALPAKIDAALQWVVRHVRLDERPGLPDAPEMVAARGRGTATERIYVFAALARQLGLEPRLVGDAGADPKALFAVAFTDGKNRIIVDPRIGLRWPDANLGDTLAKWSVHGYDVTVDRLEKSVVYAPDSLPSYSPRMKYLESILSSTGLRLAVSAAPLENVAPWTDGKPGGAPRVLAETLPLDEGGTDRAPVGERRMDRYRVELAPWAGMPQALLQVPGPLGLRLQQVFGDTAMVTHQPGLAQALKEKQQYDETLKSAIREIGDTKARKEALQAGEQQFRPSFRDDAGLSLRQLVLRGKYEDATTALVLLADRLRVTREGLRGSALEGKALEWAAKVPPVYADYLRAQRSRDPNELIAAEKPLEQLQKEGQPALEYVLWLAAGYAAADVSSLIAVCKQDQAEARWRREPNADDTKLAAQTAAQAWSLTIGQNLDAKAQGRAIQLLARTEQLQGKRAETADSYRRAATKLTGLDRAACLILADDLATK